MSAFSQIFAMSRAAHASFGGEAVTYDGADGQVAIPDAIVSPAAEHVQDEIDGRVLLRTRQISVRTDAIPTPGRGETITLADASIWSIDTVQAHNGHELILNCTQPVTLNITHEQYRRKV